MFDFEWLRKFFVSFGERTKVTPIGFEAPRTEMKHEFPLEKPDAGPKIDPAEAVAHRRADTALASVEAKQCCDCAGKRKAKACNCKCHNKTKKPVTKKKHK